MKVLSFKSLDGVVSISADTGADISNCWCRFSARVKEKASSYCDYRSTLPGVLEIAAPTLGNMLFQVGEAGSTQWLSLPPVFYETAIYNIGIYFTDVEQKPCVLHKMKEVTELFSLIPVGDNKWLLSAPLSFLNEPGLFELSFRYKPVGAHERKETFTFRVVSPKLDTKDDYNHLLSEINAEYNEIIYQYLTLTLQNLQRGGRSDNDVVWLSIFRQIASEYDRWVRYIVNRPHLRQSKSVLYDRADRIKRWSSAMQEKYALVEMEQRLGHEYFRHEEIIHTHNTRENRFVKFTLDRISKRLQNIISYIKAKNEKAKKADKIADSEFAELDAYANSLRALSNSSLFRTLRGEPLRTESMVLQKRNGYAQVYKYWILLQKGIELFDGSNAIGVRPIWELYELWCFLKMRRMIGEILQLNFENSNEIRDDKKPMTEPFDNNTSEHTVYYVARDGSSVRLHYQHTYSRSSGEVHTATTENRPDIVLTIIRPDGFELTYLFDAKYRLLDDSKLNREDKEELCAAKGADFPPSDAINQMHRYRDAIYYGSDRTQHEAKEIIGGYILFPGRGDNETMRERYFYKSIETVNIGAFPLLPDSKNSNNEGTLLYEFLSKILVSPKVDIHLGNAIPQKGLKYVSDSKWMPKSNELVLVGYYKPGQLSIILEKKLYYVPIARSDGTINLVSGFEKTKYLLLIGNEGRKLLLLKGSAPKSYSKAELQRKGFSPSGDLYFGFAIKNPEPITGIDVDKYKLKNEYKDKNPYFITYDKLIT